jgi:hypothetical protein
MADLETSNIDFTGACSFTDIRRVKTSVTVTGNDAITTTGRNFIALTNTSGTNTITLVAPSSVDGKILILQIVTLTAGTISLADSGTCALASAWTTPTVGSTLMLIANGTVWYELCRSTNS